MPGIEFVESLCLGKNFLFYKSLQKAEAFICYSLQVSAREKRNHPNPHRDP